MSGKLSTSLTGSMEAVNVEESYTEIACDETDTGQETSELSRSKRHSESASSRDIVPVNIKEASMESDDNQTVSEDSEETEERQKTSDASSDQESESSNSVTDMNKAGKRTNSASSSTVTLKRKVMSADGGRLQQRNDFSPSTSRKDSERSKQKSKGSESKPSKPGPQYFVKDWEFVQTLGEGAYGEVKLAYNNKTQEAVAVKIVNLEGQRQGVIDDIRKEVCIHRLISHKNIIKFYGMRKEGETQYIFLQYASGGELFDRIEPDLGMMQVDAQKYFRQLIDGLEYLHNKGITHRDIKPENLLLDENDDLKIADFGLATVFRHEGRWRLLDRLCGSAPYLAPEVICNKPYQAEPADIWSCGVVLVAMLAGELPWDAAVLACSDYVNWRECHIENRPWNKIDNLALCLLRRLLVDKPDKRYTIKEIRQNQWFKKDFNESALQVSPGPIRKRIRGSDFGSPCAVSCSQPTLSSGLRDPDPLRMGRDKASDSTVESDAPISFSQPAQSDDILLSTQHGTQSSQTPMQKLVRRMTRFFCKQSRSDVVEELSKVFGVLGYNWKYTTSHLITVHTQDRRQSQLTFKTMIVEMGESLLIDFRLSKGDGLEFKRQFMRIRDLMKPIICKVPSSWPNLPQV